jgi:hypothetical protein
MIGYHCCASKKKLISRSFYIIYMILFVHYMIFLDLNIKLLSIVHV